MGVYAFIRPHLLSTRNRTSPDESQSSVDEWTSRTDEPNNQRSDCQRYYYETHQQLKYHLKLFLTAYNFARRLKTLNGLTPYEYIVKCWQNDEERFKIYPNRDTLGLNI